MGHGSLIAIIQHTKMKNQVIIILIWNKLHAVRSAELYVMCRCHIVYILDACCLYHLNRDLDGECDY